MALDLARESDDVREVHAFRRNLCFVGTAHLLLLCVLFAIGKWQPRVKPAQVIWLDGGGLPGPTASTASDASNEADASRSSPVPEPDPEPAPQIPLDPPLPAPAEPSPSEIVLPRSTPAVTPRLETPRPATPKPATPKPSTPRPITPKPNTPKPITPKPSTPRPTTATSPKPKSSSPTPKTNAEKKPTDSANATPKQVKQAANTRKEKGAAADTTVATNGAGQSGTSAAGGSGTGKSGSGPGGNANEFAWYYEMLDDRFTSRWEQPLSIVRSTQQFVTTLKIRITKDGTIALREIANSSGNPLMDESVMNAARKVLAVDPLPAGLGNDSFDVNINFKLDQEQ